MSDSTRDTLSNKNTVTLREVTSGTGVALLAVLATAAGLLVLHGIDGAHATISLDQLALSGNEGGARRLSGTSEETTHHDSGSTKGKTLDDVADVLNTTIGNGRNTEASSKGADGVNGGSLGTADSHNLLGDAGRTTAHTNTDTVDTSLNKSSSLLTGNDIASNDIEAGELVLAPLDHLNLVHAVALGAVQNNDIEASINKLLEAGLVLGTSANGSSAEELLAVGKLGGKGKMLILGQVGARNHGDEVLVLVNDGKLALLGLGENFVRFGEGDAIWSGDKVRNHDIVDSGVVVLLKLQVAVGDNTEKSGAELSVLCCDLLASEDACAYALLVWERGSRSE